jgi:hypothetical protein
MAGEAAAILDYLKVCAYHYQWGKGYIAFIYSWGIIDNSEFDARAYQMGPNVLLSP